MRGGEGSGLVSRGRALGRGGEDLEQSAAPLEQASAPGSQANGQIGPVLTRQNRAGQLADGAVQRGDFTPPRRHFAFQELQWSVASGGGAGFAGLILNGSQSLAQGGHLA